MARSSSAPYPLFLGCCASQSARACAKSEEAKYSRCANGACVSSFWARLGAGPPPACTSFLSTVELDTAAPVFGLSAIYNMLVYIMVLTSEANNGGSQLQPAEVQVAYVFPPKSTPSGRHPEDST